MPFSQYLASATLNWFRNTAFPSQVANVYISIHSGIPGVNGTDNDVTATIAGSRATLAAANISAPAVSAQPGGGFESSNTVEVSLTNSALAGGSISYFGIWDAASGGNFLGYGLVTNPIASVLPGDIISFSVGQLVIRGI